MASEGDAGRLVPEVDGLDLAAAVDVRLPTGDEAKLAEFNAVLLEGLLAAVVRAIRDEEPVDLEAELEHARWFVAEHYAPFPVSLDEALRRFRDGLDVEAVVRLLPIFWQVRTRELDDPDHRRARFQITFRATDAPAAEAEAFEAQDFALGALLRVTTHGHHSPMPGIDLTPSQARLLELSSLVQQGMLAERKRLVDALNQVDADLKAHDEQTRAAIQSEHAETLIPENATARKLKSGAVRLEWPEPAAKEALVTAEVAHGRG